MDTQLQSINEKLDMYMHKVDDLKAENEELRRMVDAQRAQNGSPRQGVPAVTRIGVALTSSKVSRQGCLSKPGGGAMVGKVCGSQPFPKVAAAGHSEHRNIDMMHAHHHISLYILSIQKF